MRTSLGWRLPEDDVSPQCEELLAKAARETAKYSKTMMMDSRR